MVKAEDLVKLDEYFKADDLEWRVSQSGTKDGKPWAKVLVYVTSRAIQNRLDQVCGKDGWKTEIKQLQGGAFVCNISILVDHGNGVTEWVSKEDGADETKVEAIKGGISGSIKRAAVHWGIGRYLYEFKESWAEFVPKGGKYSAKIDNKFYSWNPPALPSWAIPVTDSEKEKLKELVLKVEEYTAAGYINPDYQAKADTYIATKDIAGLQRVVDYCSKLKK